MTLQIRCSNGHLLKVREEQAGKKVRCPTCQDILTVTLDLPEPPAPVPLPSAPLTVYCPQGHALNIPPSMVGQNIQCSLCQTVFVAAGAAPPMLDIPPMVGDVPAMTSEGTSEEAESPEVRKQRRKTQLALARGGLLCHVCMVFSMFIAGLFGGISNASKNVQTEKALAPIIMIFQILGGLLFMTGAALCAFVPSKAEASGFFLCAIPPFLIAFILQFFLHKLPLLVAIIPYVLMFAAWCAFLFGIKALAVYRKSREIENRTMSVFYTGCGLIVLAILFVVIAVVLKETKMSKDAALALVMSSTLVLGIYGLVVYIRYLLLLFAARQMLAR